MADRAVTALGVEGWDIGVTRRSSRTCVGLARAVEQRGQHEQHEQRGQHEQYAGFGTTRSARLADPAFLHHAGQSQGGPRMCAGCLIAGPPECCPTRPLMRKTALTDGQLSYQENVGHRVTRTRTRSTRFSRTAEREHAGLEEAVGALAALHAELGGMVDMFRQLDVPEAAVATRDAAVEVSERARGVVDRSRSDVERIANRLGGGGLVVGTVGEARSGKSRFLQSLTGLDHVAIPDSPGDFCTGVASVISAGPVARAQVYFKTEQDFLLQVKDYYRSLEKSPSHAIGGDTPPRAG